MQRAVFYALCAIIAACQLAGHGCVAADGSCASFLQTAMTADKNVFKVYIAGKWRESSSGKALPILAPHNETEIYRVQACTQSEIDEAFEAARSVPITSSTSNLANTSG
jgi:hypothetical protein